MQKEGRSRPTREGTFVNETRNPHARPDVPATLVARDRFSGVVRFRRAIPADGTFGLRRRINPRFPDPLVFDPVTGSSVEVNGEWVADWWEIEDETISRVHALLRWCGDRLSVRRVLAPRRTRNPIRFESVERDDFDLRPGGSFESGRTRFTLLAGDRTNDDGPETDSHTGLPAVSADPGK